MVANVAFFDCGRFIVLVVPENSWRPLRVFKSLVVNDDQIFLLIGRYREKTTNRKYRQNEQKPSPHRNVSFI
jgi:hypothetical protein